MNSDVFYAQNPEFGQYDKDIMDVLLYLKSGFYKAIKSYVHYWKEGCGASQSEGVHTYLSQLGVNIRNFLEEECDSLNHNFESLIQEKTQYKEKAFVLAKKMGKGDDIIDWDTETSIRLSEIATRGPSCIMESIEYYKSKYESYYDIYMRKDQDCKCMLMNYNKKCDLLGNDNRLFVTEDLNMRNGQNIYSVSLYDCLQKETIQINKQYETNKLHVHETLQQIYNLNSIYLFLQPTTITVIPCTQSTYLDIDLQSLYSLCHYDQTDMFIQYQYSDSLSIPQSYQQYLLTEDEYIDHFGMSDEVISQLEESYSNLHLLSERREQERTMLTKHCDILCRILLYLNNSSDAMTAVDTINSNNTEDEDSIENKLCNYKYNKNTLSLYDMNNMIYYLNLLYMVSIHNYETLSGLIIHEIQESWRMQRLPDTFTITSSINESLDYKRYGIDEDILKKQYSLFSRDPKIQHLLFLYYIQESLINRYNLIQSIYDSTMFKNFLNAKNKLDYVLELEQQKKNNRFIGKTKDTMVSDKYLYQKTYQEQMKSLTNYMQLQSSSSLSTLSLDVTTLMQLYSPS